MGPNPPESGRNQPICCDRDEAVFVLNKEETASFPRHAALSDKEEVPGSSPGSPIRGAARKSAGLRQVERERQAGAGECAGVGCFESISSGGLNMESRASQEPRGSRPRRRSHRCAVALVAATALLLVPAAANAASPILEFVVPGHGFPIPFTTESGAVTAQMAGFESLVHCTASSGKGEITGPRSTVSEYRFTGCTAGGQECKSEEAQNEEEITTGQIAGDLVYIAQAKNQVGILLNPGDEKTYISFKCGGIPAEGRGPFLATVGPLNQEATVFTATLAQLDSVQTPDEYEGEKGEQLQAIPTGKRGSENLVPTGVELSMTIHSSVPGEIKAITAQEVEAKQREEEAEKLEANLKKQEEALKAAEEHAKQVAEEAKKHEAEANARVAAEAKRREEAEKPKPKHLELGQVLARALRKCKQQPKSRRARCVANVHKKFGPSAPRRVAFVKPA
jgi:hypothetical protein